MTKAISLNLHAEAVIHRMTELDTAEKKETVRLYISRYSSPDRSDSPHLFAFIARKVDHIACRLFNALKACFNQSDWQKAERLLAGCFREKGVNAGIIETQHADSPNIWAFCLGNAQKMLTAALDAQNIGQPQWKYQESHQELSQRMQALRVFIQSGKKLAWY